DRSACRRIPARTDRRRRCRISAVYRRSFASLFHPHGGSLTHCVVAVVATTRALSQLRFDTERGPGERFGTDAGRALPLLLVVRDRMEPRSRSLQHLWRFTFVLVGGERGRRRPREGGALQRLPYLREDDLSEARYDG